MKSCLPQVVRRVLYCVLSLKKNWNVGTGLIPLPFTTSGADIVSALTRRPFNDAQTFNTQIRNMVQTVKYRGGRRVVPNAARRAAGFRQLRVAMKVRMEEYLWRAVDRGCQLPQHSAEESRLRISRISRMQQSLAACPWPGMIQAVCIHVV